VAPDLAASIDGHPAENAVAGRAGDPPPAAAATGNDYEQLRATVTGGTGGGWRYGRGVLAAAGMAAWITAWPAQAAASRAAAPQAGVFPPAHDQSLPALGAEGGDARSPARLPLPPGATTTIVEVLAQMTLTHARTPGPAARGYAPAAPP
jgi:hypothetical protein